MNRFLQMLMLLWWSMYGTEAPAIIFGQDVEHSSTNASASVVALQMPEIQPDGSTHYYKGSAFLIAPNLLLTAGHNLAYIPDPTQVEVIFSSTPCWGPNTCHEKRVKVAKAVVHPQFHQVEGGTEFDLAIVKLEANAPDDYRTIPLIDEKETLEANLLHVFGFGLDHDVANVPLSAFRLRTIALSALEPNYILGSKQKFWLDQSNGGICGGDSGGPSILVNGSSSVAIGLAIHVTYSDGVSHCLTKSAFTDLKFFKNWIDSVLNAILR